MQRTVFLRDLIAKPLDLVKTKWELMLSFIESRDVILADPDARVKVGAKGTSVTFEAPKNLNHPFRVSFQSRRIRVSPGYVDDHIPTVEGIDLTGRNREGEKENRQYTLELEESAEPGEDGRSFIVIRMDYDPGRKQPLIDLEKDWLTIAHVSNLKEARKEAGSEQAIEPLAVLYWTDQTITDRGQIVRHNLKSSYRSGDPGRHFFSAV